MSSLGVGIDQHTNYLRVCDFVLTNGSWDWDRIDNLVPRNVRSHIATIMAPNPTTGCDRLAWKWSDSDGFSSAASYKHLFN